MKRGNWRNLVTTGVLCHLIWGKQLATGGIISTTDGIRMQLVQLTTDNWQLATGVLGIHVLSHIWTKHFVT